MLDTLLDWIMMAIVGACVLLVIVMFVGLFIDMGSPTIALRKDAWQCSKGHNEQSVSVIVGNIIIPQQQFVCDQWTRQ